MTYDDVLVSSEHGNPVIMCNHIPCIMSTAHRVMRVRYSEGRVKRREGGRSKGREGGFEKGRERE